jgi:hypothetical protein
LVERITHGNRFLLAIATRVLACAAVSKAAAPAPAFAFEAAAGFTAVEEGDDRIRPGAALHVGINDAVTSRLYFYGRENGPVREETYLASVNRRWSLFKSDSVTANIGLAVMNERIKLDFDKAEDEAFNEDESNYNAGLAFGVAWSLPKTAGPLYMTVAWDSHLFPAGLNGLVFLSTGRKQTITVAMGVALK